jgi:hypothetical protein
MVRFDDQRWSTTIKQPSFPQMPKCVDEEQGENRFPPFSPASPCKFPHRFAPICMAAQ